MNKSLSLYVILSAIVVLVLSPLLALAKSSSGEGVPQTLRETGLYRDWNTKTVGPNKIAFSPQYPLWSDGATKTRWIQLPPRTFIDASQPDAWKFPIGTQIWKEFKFSRRAETRYMKRTASGWKYATYIWNDDETEATLAPDRGVRNSVEINAKVRHAIPSQSDCHACHEATSTTVLGFSALQLSADRDPNAVHSEPLPAGDATLRSLIRQGLVRGLPRHLLSGVPRIDAKTPVARAAMGYLHGNCGGCHNGNGELASLDFSLKYTLADPRLGRAPAEATAFGHVSKYVPPAWDSPGDRIRPGDPDHSVLIQRIGTRNPYAQMPPLGTRIVDDQAVALIRKWIAEETAAERKSH